MTKPKNANITFSSLLIRKGMTPNQGALLQVVSSLLQKPNNLT